MRLASKTTYKKKTTHVIICFSHSVHLIFRNDRNRKRTSTRSGRGCWRFSCLSSAARQSSKSSNRFGWRKIAICGRPALSFSAQPKHNIIFIQNPQPHKTDKTYIQRQRSRTNIKPVDEAGCRTASQSRQRICSLRERERERVVARAEESEIAIVK